MKSLFSVGEVAKIKEITIKALRYYHKMGILIPKYVDETTGYRYYAIDQFVYIDIIKGCRALGTSIVELQEIFKECDTDQLLEFLQSKREEAEENINKMKEVIENIDTMNRNIKHYREILSHDEIAIRFFEERYIITVPCEEVGSLKELLYYSDLEKMIQDKKVKTSMERGILYDFNLAGDIVPRYVFNTMEEKGNREVEDYVKILPKGKYLTLAYSKEDEEACKMKIRQYIKKNHLKITSLIEVDLIEDFFDTESYSCQIQMFIEE